MNADLLTMIANWAAILTAGVAIFGYGKYWCDRRSRKKALELHLRNQKSLGEDKGQRTILHLVAKLGMTEAQILEASFDSSEITRRLATDKDTKMASDILLEWNGE